jgi:hypothetical protein
MSVFGRGDGVGVEFTPRIVRGVRLSAEHDGRVAAVAELSLVDIDDERSVLDTLVRLRAELGDPDEPTRVAVFPPTSTLHRLDVTGWSGNELNDARTALEHRRGIVSSLLLDDGPRRWLLAVQWDEALIGRVEDLVERAGFRDAAVEPSPVALARVLPAAVTRARRTAATDDAFEMVCAGAIPVAAAAVPSVGLPSPDLLVDTREVASDWFDGIEDPIQLVSELGRFVDGTALAPLADTELRLAGVGHPAYPPHDLRSPQRQCVALGAAVGAAGLAGRLRPVDMVTPAGHASTADRPWAIERVSNLPPKPEPASLGPVKRSVSRLLGRRSTRDQSSNTDGR